MVRVLTFRNMSAGSKEAPFDDPEISAGFDCFGDAVELIVENRKKRQEILEADDPLSDGAIEPLPNPSLYHYTTAQGLQGIIEQGTLHASAAYYMNDASEIDYGCDLFALVLENWIRLNALSHSPANIALHNIAAFFKDMNRLQPILSRVYVACFCEEENLLSQWRAYGQSGGYSLGFLRANLEHKIGVKGRGISLKQVIYRERHQRRILECLLADTLPVLGETAIDAKLSKLTSKGVAVFQAGFDSVLQIMALGEIVRFKHPAFIEEKEWRLISQPVSAQIPPEETNLIKFKPSRGMLTPYIELTPQSGTLLPINSVRYGPTLDKKRVENALTVLFRKHGYSGIQFHGSDIPVRL